MMSRYKVFWYLTLVASLTLLLREAHSQPVDPTTAKALQHFRKGQELFRAEKYKPAIVEFKAAQKLKPAPALLYNIAECYEKLGELEDLKKAVQYLESYIKAHKEAKGVDPPDIKSLRRKIKRMREDQIPDLLPVVAVNSTPSGANVYLDNPKQVAGQTPRSFNMEPGPHKLWLKLDGYVPFETEFNVEVKKDLNLNFTLKKILREGALKFNINVKRARIFIDGKTVGMSPFLEPVKVSEGKHQVIVEKDRYSSVNESVVVPQGKTVEKEYELSLVSPPYSWRGYVGWTSVGLGLCGIAAGIVFANLANKEFNDTDTFKNWKNGSTAGYAAGGSLLAVGTGLVIWEYVRDAVDEDDLVYVPRQLQFDVAAEGGVVVTGGWEF